MTTSHVDPESGGVRADLVLAFGVLAVWLGGAALARREGLWLGLGGAAVALATVLTFVDGRRIRELFSLAPLPIGAGLAAGALATLLTRPLFALLASVAPWVRADVAILYGRLGATAPAWGPVALAVVVVAEEIVWRGSVQGAIQRRFGATSSAVLLAAALYALALVPFGSPLLVLVAFACGVLWSGLRVATGGLVAPLLAHLLWDQAVLYFFPVMPLR